MRLKGNTKQMERELDVPYSTVRTRLDDVVRELGPEQGVRTATSTDTRSGVEILDRLDRGEITSEDAIAKLRGE